MADGAEYVFQLFDEDAYLGYTDVRGGAGPS